MCQWLTVTNDHTGTDAFACFSPFLPRRWAYCHLYFPQGKIRCSLCSNAARSAIRDAIVDCCADKWRTPKVTWAHFSHQRSCCSAGEILPRIALTRRVSRNARRLQLQRWLWNFHRQQIAHCDGSAFSGKLQVSAKCFWKHLKDVL